MSEMDKEIIKGLQKKEAIEKFEKFVESFTENLDDFSEEEKEKVRLKVKMHVYNHCGSIAWKFNGLD